MRYYEIINKNAAQTITNERNLFIGIYKKQLRKYI